MGPPAALPSLTGLSPASEVGRKAGSSARGSGRKAVLFSNISFGEDPALSLRARGQDKKDGGRGGGVGVLGGR